MSFFSNLSNRLRVSNKNMGNYFCEKTKHVMKLTLDVTKTKIRSISWNYSFILRYPGKIQMVTVKLLKIDKAIKSIKNCKTCSKF